MITADHLSVLLLVLSLLTCASSGLHHTTDSPSLLDRYILRTRGPREPLEHLDPTYPPLLPNATLSCSIVLLQHDFAYTYGSPPTTAIYTPPDDDTTCGDWTRAVLDLSVSCAGEQYDRIAAVWIDGVEILRTSTAEPSESGIFWKVLKDVSKFSSVLRSSSSLTDRVVSMMLENIVNDIFTGIYHVNLSLHFYAEEKKNVNHGELGNVGFLVQTRSTSSRKPDVTSGFKDDKFGLLYEKPADLIIPICNEKGDDGFWFRITNDGDSYTKNVQIPSNAHRAVLEMFISFHSDDEFWYSNPPNSYLEKNHLDTGRGNGSFRQVFATIDGLFVGSVVPYAVVFTGGINPLFWAPVVSIGAFNLPSYDLELTPFLGNLLDGKSHKFGLGVTDAISYWLIDANLHLWLDHGSDSVIAKLVDYNAPSQSISRKSDWVDLDGKFRIKAEREAHFIGWANSSLGNITTVVGQEFKFNSSVEFRNKGNVKEVSTNSKSKTQVNVECDDHILMTRTQEFEFPLWFETDTIPGEEKAYTSITNISHVFYDKSSVLFDELSYTSTVSDEQSGDGWMEVEGQSVLSGLTKTEQTYSHIDDKGCYLRTISTKDAEILVDEISTSCLFYS